MLSKKPNHVNSLANLRNAKFMGRILPIIDLITFLLKSELYLLVSVSFVVIYKMCYILQENELRLLLLENFDNIPKYGASNAVFHAHLTAGFGKRLTWKASA